MAAGRPAWNSDCVRDASEYRLPPAEMLRRKALLQPRHHAFHQQHAKVPASSQRGKAKVRRKKKQQEESSEGRAPGKPQQQQQVRDGGSSYHDACMHCLMPLRPSRFTPPLLTMLWLLLLLLWLLFHGSAGQAAGRDDR